MDLELFNKTLNVDGKIYELLLNAFQTDSIFSS